MLERLAERTVCRADSIGVGDTVYSERNRPLVVRGVHPRTAHPGSVVITTDDGPETLHNDARVYVTRQS